MSTQLSLLDVIATAPAPRKRVRAVSREAYRHQRAIDIEKAEQGRETREGQVLRCLAWRRNLTGQWSTAAELANFMFRHHELPRDDSRLVAPRLTTLGPGDYRRGVLKRAGGLIEMDTKRICTVTGTLARPWRVLEIGSGRAR